MDRIEQLKHPNRHVVKSSNAMDVATVSTGCSSSTILASSKSSNGAASSSSSNGLQSLSKDEVEILKRSSKIDSGLFLPWSDEDAQALSRHVQNLSESKYIKLSSWQDPNGHLELSDKQRKRFEKFARPMEISKMRNSSIRQKPPVMYKSINPYTIKQAYVTDCSFIASLCICSLFEKKFRKRLVTSIVYPQDKNGVPIVNPEGRYMVKLWLNGVPRAVEIDDFLPIDRHANLLCSHTSSLRQEDRQHLELWVSLIEKGKMTMCQRLLN